MPPRSVFLASGSIEHWQHGRKLLMWGLSRGGCSWNECRAVLQECGLRAGAEILACAGPLALFRAVVDEDVFYDPTPVWTLPAKNRRELYPVRFKLTRVRDVNANWYRGADNWRYLLQDVYPPKRGWLFTPRDDTLRRPGVVRELILGDESRPSDRHDPTAPPTSESRDAATDFRRRYPAPYRADDGHYVRSKAELTICNWLHYNGIPHAYERKLPVPEDVISDFYVGIGQTCYIEYWGLEGAEYQRRRIEKMRVYRAHRLNLIELTEADVTKLDDVLPQRLRHFGITVS
jgi:hypothetical protein